MFWHNSRLSWHDITDGLSNTIAIGERNSKLDYSTWVGVVHGVEYSVARIVATTIRTPNSVDGRFEDFSSSHPGATLFLFADGSVRTIYDEVDAEMFTALGSRHGEEIISWPDR